MLKAPIKGSKELEKDKYLGNIDIKSKQHEAGLLLYICGIHLT